MIFLLVLILIILVFLDEVFKPNYDDVWDSIFIEFNIYNHEITALEKNVIEYYRHKGIVIVRKYKPVVDNERLKTCIMHIQGPKDVIQHIENQISFAYVD